MEIYGYDALGVFYVVCIILLSILHFSGLTHTSGEVKKKTSQESGDDSVGKQKIIEELNVIYTTERGSAKVVVDMIQEVVKGVNVYRMKDLLMEIDELQKMRYIVFVVPSYADGKTAKEGNVFFDWLQDIATDFRVHKGSFEKVRFSVIGLGDSAFSKVKFNKAGKTVDKWMVTLGAKRFIPSMYMDTGAASDLSSQVQKYLNRYEKYNSGGTVVKVSRTKKTRNHVKIDVPSDDDNMYDIEDIGSEIQTEEEPEMITPLIRKNLTKQGYKIFGSHSAVKLCRWTKGMLRGRGGCYKHTAYGITSYQCMEMTPSIACASQCEFCWRHHTNPIARTWKYKTDKPEFLIKNAIQKHQNMIKQMKGVPGVTKERYQDGFNIRHCALSLVGEPIIYPYINEFMDLLHEKKISSFLVTNAQFPEQLKSVQRVTQLYISVDAPTKEAMKKVDRPVFDDFWEKFIDCVDILATKKIRTVFRMTLIKDKNMDDAAEYAKLIKRGNPSFVEIKGVTFCGSSSSSDMTMKNVPFHTEVKKYAFELCNYPGMEDYEPAAIHEHSCFVLIAHKKFKRNNEWNTWIDYDKFHELIQSGKDFTDEDYMARTPSWALIDSAEQGFDPNETRWERKKKGSNSETS